MTVFVNGEARELAADLPLVELLATLGLPTPTLLVEHNGLALRRDEWPGRILRDGDRLEIIRIVAGG